MELFSLLGTIAINSTEAERSINSVAKEAGKIGDGFVEGEKVADKSLSDIAAANGKTVTQIKSEVSKVAAEYQSQGMSAEESMKKAYADIGVASQHTTEKMKNDAKGAGETTKLNFGKIGSAAVTIAKGIGAAGAALGGAFIGAVEGTREYRTALGKLDTAFKTNGHSSKDATKTYKSLQSVLGDTDVSVEAANHLAVLTNNSKDLNTWTDICTGVFATFGDSLPIEGLTEAANETAKVGQVTGPLADALNWAGISEDDFNKKLEKCSSEQERQKLIMNTLNKTYKDASDTYKKTNKDVIDANAAQERLTSTMARLGEIGEPIMTAIKNAIASMAEKAIPVLEDLIVKTKDLIKWFKENEQTVKNWAVTIGIATITAAGFVLILSWSAIMAAAKKAITSVTTAVKAFNLAMKANWIALVITAIAGLVAAFIYLWNNCEEFRIFWQNLWKAIQNAFFFVVDGIKAAWKGVSSYFSESWDAMAKDWKLIFAVVKKMWTDMVPVIMNTWNMLVGFFKGIWDGIVNIFKVVGKWFGDQFRQGYNNVQTCWNAAKAFFQAIWNGIKAVFSTVVSFYKTVFQTAWNVVKTVWNAYKTFFTAVWNGIKAIFSTVASWFKSMFERAWNGVKVTWNMSKAFFQGIWNAIKKTFSTVGSWFSTAFKTAWNAVKTIWNASKKFFQTIWNGIKSVFNVVKTFFADKFKSAWNAIKNSWNAAKTFFTTVWGWMKKPFEAAGSWFRGIFQKAWSGIKSVFSSWGSFFGGLWTTIKDKFSAIGTKIGTSVGSAVKSGINGVISSIEKVINGFIGSINGALKWINKIPKVQIGKVPTVHFGRLAKGGIVDAETPFIAGEDGAEAIIPLERNTEWIGSVADEFQKRSHSSGNDVDVRLNRIIALLEELLGMKICLDSGALVGELTPAIDTQLGKIYSQVNRGNRR